MSEKTYKDFESKKTIHFNLTRESHSSLRIACFKMRLSMQEVFEEICQKISSEQADIMKILSQISEDKKNKKIKQLSKNDAESIFNIIEESNPFRDESND